MNFTASSVLNVRASSSASLMMTAGGVLRVAQELAHRHPQDQTIDHRHPLGTPVLGRLGDQRVDLRRDAARCRARAPPRTRGGVRRRLRVGPLQSEERLDGRVDVALRFPLIQDLQGGFARAVTRSFFTVIAWPRERVRRPSPSRCAATAASQPLLAGPSPARSIASSTEFVVSTPNAIGTPVSAAAA